MNHQNEYRNQPVTQDHRFDRILYQRQYEEIMKLPFHGKVVDLGCGTAPFREHILTTADEYVGIDWKNSEHDQSRVDLFADLTGPLPLPDQCADIVTVFQVMEHLAEPSRFLDECWRILKPGGAIYLTTPFMHKIHEAPHDYYRYTRHGLEYLLEKSGFTNILVREYAGFWQMLTMKFNYWSGRHARGIFRYFWYAIWEINQPLAVFLDRFTHYPEETIAYITTAARPAPLPGQ